MEPKQKLDLEKADNQIITYLEILINKKGLGSMPPEILKDMLMDLYPRFEKFLFLSAMQNLTEEGYKKMDAFIGKKPKPEKSMEFLKENIKDFPAVIEKAMNDFEDIYLGKKKVETEE